MSDKINKDELFDLYAIAEITYENHCCSNLPKDKIYPKDWYGILNYNEKINILSEAIENKILIKDTDEYKKLID